VFFRKARSAPRFGRRKLKTMPGKLTVPKRFYTVPAGCTRGNVRVDGTDVVCAEEIGRSTMTSTQE